MKHVELNGNTVVTVRGAPYPPDAPTTIEAPDSVECGWEKQGANWVKGEALIAQEADAADKVARTASVKAKHAEFKAGTAKTKDIQDAIAVWLDTLQ
jgi:hypothetical protein